MPVVLEGEPQDNKAYTAKDSGGICNDQTRFWVETTTMAIDVQAADDVVEEMSNQPAGQDTGNAKEIKIACSIPMVSLFCSCSGEGQKCLPKSRGVKP